MLNMQNKEIVEGYKILQNAINKNQSQRTRLSIKKNEADSWEERSKYIDEIDELDREYDELFNAYQKFGGVKFRLNLADLLERTLENNKNLNNIDVSIKYTLDSDNAIEELYKNGGIKIRADIIMSSGDSFYVPLCMKHAYLRYSNDNTNNNINSKIRLNISGNNPKITFPIHLHDIDVDLGVNQIFALSACLPSYLREFAGVNCFCFIDAAIDIICEDKGNVKRLKK